VGINYAIQDAIVAANTLGPRLLRGEARTRDLAAVQRRREWVTRLMQSLQTVGEHQALAAPAPRTAQWIARVLTLPVMHSIRERLIAFGGLSPERVADGTA
jgi:2-polyprenyl-6-methoxyphenol hydroxylase-like FAD-dependent oxidoreductase